MELSAIQKGRESEKMVRAVLAELRDEGFISGFRKTRWYSSDDRKGIDFWIFTEQGRIPLQVKSSRRAQEVYEYYYRFPCVVGMSPNLKNTLKKIVKEYHYARRYST